MRPAVVLLSGGLDSATVAAIARRDGFAVHALSIDYGQRHASELAAARRVAAATGVVDHKILALDLRAFGGSALTDDIDVPHHDDAAPAGDPIPVTYVPARNTIFLSLALAWAEVLGSNDIFVGVNAVDYSGYPDCRPEFIEAFEAMARLATKAAVTGTGRLTIHAPLIAMTKAEIVTHGAGLGVDYSLTVSCYEADDAGAACGRCESCHLRRRGFEVAALADPTVYRGGTVAP